MQVNSTKPCDGRSRAHTPRHSSVRTVHSKQIAMQYQTCKCNLVSSTIAQPKGALCHNPEPVLTTILWLAQSLRRVTSAGCLQACLHESKQQATATNQSSSKLAKRNVTTRHTRGAAFLSVGQQGMKELGPYNTIYVYIYIPCKGLHRVPRSLIAW